MTSLNHALICGFGSIGRRHYRHLQQLGCKRVDLYRTGKGSLGEVGDAAPDHVFDDLAVALEQHPEVVLVTNPTALHVPTALQAVQAGCHVLVEKPISHSLDGVNDLADAAIKQKVVVGVAYNLRFHPVVQQIRSYLSDSSELGEPYSARAHIGTYLPDWHPWEDYRTSYAAKRGLGGGCALTNSHELDYILWLFGAADRWQGMAMKEHPLGTDVDEACSFVIQHQRNVFSTVTMNYLQKPARRTVEVLFERGTVRGDLLDASLEVRLASGETRSVSFAPFDIDTVYGTQLVDFIERIEGRDAIGATIDEARHVLEVALLTP